MRACNDEWSELLSAWADGELTPAEQAQVDAHLTACPTCAGAVEGYLVLGERLRGAADTHVPVRVLQRARGLQPRRPWRRPLAGLAAAAAVVVGLLAAPALAPGGLDDALAHELTQHHYRAFARSTPWDFESADPVEVRRWLISQLGYEVDVPEVEGAGLLGARLCQLGGVVTAAILYRVGEEAVTVFVPQRDAPAERAAEAFADGQIRCTGGALGDAICASADGGGGRLAVASLEPSALRLLLEPKAR